MFTLADRRVHGLCDLPYGYGLACLPRGAAVASQYGAKEELGQAKIRLASSFCSVKALVALLQTLYAGMTLYNVRGDQLARYGFAAFGLTVTHYLVMTIINVVAHLATPDYAAMFMIRSETMDEAERHGGMFEGEVGFIDAPRSDDSSLFCVFQASNDDGSKKPAGRASTSHVEQRRPRVDLLFFRQASGGMISHCKSAGSDISPARLDRPLDKEAASASVLVVPSCSISRRDRVSEEPEDGDELFSSLWLHRMLSLHGRGIADRVRITRREAGRISRRGIFKTVARFVLKVAIASLSLIIIGYISHFKPGHSSVAQRGWIMSWTCTNKVIGPWIQSVRDIKGISQSWKLTLLLMSSVFLAPSVGGLVTVAGMMEEFGSCVSLK